MVSWKSTHGHRMFIVKYPTTLVNLVYWEWKWSCCYAMQHLHNVIGIITSTLSDYIYRSWSRGWIGWLATPPWVCRVHNTNSLFEDSLIYLNNHSCKQNVWWDANRSLRQGKQRIINIFKARSVACFILFTMVVEHWQLQEHMDWHKAPNE